ncbi:MAG TPA: nuclear transport factor 2 family protein [Solirubrobacteraceae bacterium]
MTNANQIVERYLDVFNQTEPARRRELLEQLWLEDGTYTDPHVEVRGPEGVDAFIAQTQERFPGYTFTLGSEIDAHHDQARFQWHAGPDDEPAQYVGFDVIVTDGGRIRNVYGFMDAAPAA